MVSLLLPRAYTQKPPAGISPSGRRAQGLVRAIPFNEGGGLARDLISTAFTTFASGPTWQSGRMAGPAVDMAGTAYVDIGNMNLGVPATICMWLTPDSVNNDDRILGFTDNNGTSNFNGLLRTNGNGNVEVLQSGGTWAQICAVGSLAAGTLSCIVVTYDGTNANGYVGGHKSASASCSSFDFNLGHPAGIGVRFTFNGTPFGNTYKGAVEQFFAYSRVLPDEEIEELAVIPFSPYPIRGLQRWFVGSPPAAIVGKAYIISQAAQRAANW